MRERVEAMKEIWTKDKASTGAIRQLRADLVVAEAGPAGRTRRCGSAATASRVLDRVLAFGDEWLPYSAPDDELLTRIEELNSRASQAGRRPVPVSVAGPFGELDRIERLERAGVHRIVAWLPPGARPRSSRHSTAAPPLLASTRLPMASGPHADRPEGGRT